LVNHREIGPQTHNQLTQKYLLRVKTKLEIKSLLSVGLFWGDQCCCECKHYDWAEMAP